MKKKTKNSVADISVDKIISLINTLKENQGILKEKKITAGFDGFIDTISKIIKTKQHQKASFLFTTIKEFGEYIIEKEGSSFSLETEEQNKKMGGNMPIMANALGQLGTSVNCIGALGYPQLHPVFKDLSSNCRPFPFAEPGTATAYEFIDGKIMLAQMGTLNTMGWEKIKEVIGIDTLTTLYRESDLICFLNWSEIDASTNIWKGFLKDVLPTYSTTPEKQIAFFDLSDCSKRNHQSITEVLELIKLFVTHTNVILSLNKNEARIINRVLNNKAAIKDLLLLGKNIKEKLNIQMLVLHSAREAIGFSNNHHVHVKSFFTSEPKISTGAGDNFNAGFCAAQLMQLDLESSLLLANAVSGYYVRNGISGQFSDIEHFLHHIHSSAKQS